MLELIISDAIRRAKKRVSRKGFPPLERQRTLIREALTHIGWEPALAQRDAEAFGGGDWEQYVRSFAPEWERGRGPPRGHILWGANVYRLTAEQFMLLHGDEPGLSVRMAHLRVRMFIAIYQDESTNPALFWSSIVADPHPSTRRQPASWPSAVPNQARRW